MINTFRDKSCLLNTICYQWLTFDMVMWVVVILEQGFNPSTLWWTIYSGYSSTSVVHTERLNGK